MHSVHDVTSSKVYVLYTYRFTVQFVISSESSENEINQLLKFWFIPLRPNMVYTQVILDMCE